jgi:hypothetical protein
MMERWLPVVGHEGAYEVSDLGRVRSLARTTMKRMGQGDTPDRLIKHSVPARDLALAINSRGYVIVALGGQSHAVHTLVLTAFVGPCPPGMECRHGDDVGHHNHLSNLCWGTPSENRGDMKRLGNLPAGESHGRAKLTAADVATIRDSDLGPTALARQYGVSPSAIRAARNGVNWKGLAA